MWHLVSCPDFNQVVNLFFSFSVNSVLLCGGIQCCLVPLNATVCTSLTEVMFEENNFSKTIFSVTSWLRMLTDLLSMSQTRFCNKTSCNLSSEALPHTNQIKRAFIDAKYNRESISQAKCPTQTAFPFKFPASCRFFMCYSAAKIVVMQDQTALCFQNCHHVERHMEYQHQRKFSCGSFSFVGGMGFCLPRPIEQSSISLQ